jgi:hypothetical protein
MWYIRKVRNKKQYKWLIFLSCYGMAYGYSRTRKAAARALFKAQAELKAGD